MSAVSKLDAVCPTAWQGEPVPERQWLIPGILLRGTVTILSGDGGVGKSLLAQQLATAMALGQPFLGIAPQAYPVKSLAMFCEDSIEELHYRQAQINAHYGCRMSDLGAMTLVSRVAQDNGLMDFDVRDHGNERALYHQLEHLSRETGAELKIVDTAADTFHGNENIRTHVRQFIAAMTRLAMINNGGVLLNLHPSLTGLVSGSGLSGNTAWHNSVRGRLYLKRPPTAEGEEEQTNDRLLKLMKSNYGPMGDELKLVWRDHVFVREDAGRSTGNTVDRIDLDNAVMSGLRKLVANGAKIPADLQANNGLAVRLSKLPSCRPWSRRALSAAQERLIAHGKIVKVELGTRTRKTLYVRPHDMRLPGELDIAEDEA
jgi:RecA-family ATPase